MPTYSTKDYEAALERMGFRRDTTHHQMFWYFDGDRKTSIRTRTSHGEKKFDDSLLAMRRKQIGSLSKAQFLALLNGSLSPAVFRQHLLDNGILQPPADQEQSI